MWIEWKGGECPITGTALLRLQDGTLIHTLDATGNDWSIEDVGGDIISYSPGWHRFVGEHPEGEVEVVLHDESYQFGSERAINWNEVKCWRAIPESRHRSAQSILRKAADLIEERGKQRDQANGEKSMLKTVQAFNTIYGTSLTEVQGWHFMELLKMTRSAYGVYVVDDFEDKVAYAALAAEAAK